MPQAALKKYFGFDHFRPGQEQIITTLLENRSSLAVFPTGSGKSLCYQLPALLLDGLTLVISPLVALMKDQVDALTSRGIDAARLDSSLDAAEFQKITDSLRSRSLRILYIAPERLANAKFLASLRRQNIALLAVDEAHCISEWGHNFRPDYLKIARLAEELKIPRCLALTATATPAVSEDIRRAFNITEADHVQTGFRRPNLALGITPCPADQKNARLVDLLKDQTGPSITYVTHQRTAEEVAGALSRAKVPARAYHAGMRPEDRAEVQEGFMAGTIDNVVATIAFGMGIDKSNIRAIYHYNLPKSLENYVQETGRAGRDGDPATCQLLACEDDRIALENFVFGDTPTPSAIKSLVERILLQGSQIEISRYHLARALDIRPLVIETVLTYLELDGLIRATGSTYSTYKIRPVRDIDQIAAGHTPGRAKFIRDIFAAGKKGYTWITLNIAEASAELGEPHTRILKALTWLEESGDIGLKPSGLLHSYDRLKDKTEISIPETTKRLQHLFAEREQREVDRIESVLSFARDPGCLTGHLLAHFGEELPEPCGTCTSCRENDLQTPPASCSQPERQIPATAQSEISTEDIEIAQFVAAEKKPALRSPRQLARFLCGINSPAATAARLGRHDHFAHLQNHPFQSVLALTESMILT